METQNCTHTISTPSLPPTAHFPSFGKRLLEMMLGWSARSRQRRDLAGLNDVLLRDIGLTSRDVEREITKPFWRP